MSEYNVWIAAVQSVKSLWWKKQKEKKKISQVIHFSHFTIKVNRTRQLPATPISFLTTSNTRLVNTLMSVTVGRQKNKVFTDKHPVLERQDLSHRLGTRQRNDRCQAAGVTFIPTVTSLCMTKKKKKYLDCHRVWSALNLVVQGFLQVRWRRSFSGLRFIVVCTGTPNKGFVFHATDSNLHSDENLGFPCPRSLYMWIKVLAVQLM